MTASTEFLTTLAWSLLHFVWQGAAIAALAAALLFVFRKPDVRYLVGVGALALMFVSFAVTFTLVDGAAGDAQTTSAARAPAAALASPHPDAIATPNTMLAGSQAAISSEDFLWVARLWLVGVCVLALRIAFGLFVLEQMRRRDLVELPAELVARFRALQVRLGIQRLVRYCECPRIGVPAVIGFFRPIVLLPMRALTGLAPEQLEAVIAHELGHVKRFDLAVNFLQVIAETLFFFHPAVWWLNRRIRAEREDCCDDVAVRACGGRVGYARALASMATWREVPALALALASTGGPVAARVARLLGMRAPDEKMRASNMLTATLVLVTAVIAGTISIGVVGPAFAQGDDVATRMEDTSDANVIDPALEFELAETLAIAEALRNATADLREPTAPEDVTAPLAPLAPPAPPAPPAPLAPLEPVAPAAPPAPAPESVKSYIEEMKLAGLENLDADSLVALKNQDVEVEYVQELQRLGVDVDANVVLAMKVQGVSPEFVREMRAAGFKPSAQELIQMKVFEITPEFQRTFERNGYQLDVSQLVEAKVMGVTPAFIEQVRAHGFKDLSIHQLIQLKNADVL